MPPAAPQSAFPNRRVFKDMPVTSWTGGWSTSSIDGAINAHDQGMFMLSAQLAEAVQRDARVSSALNTRAKGVVGLPVTITASPVGDPELAELAAEAIRQRWRESNWAADLVQVLRWQILMGFGLAELVWSGTAEQWDFDLKLWHPQFLWFNWADRAYTCNTAEGPVTVNPGDGKWLLYTPEGPYRAWINGGVRSIAQPWLGRQHEKRDWMRSASCTGSASSRRKFLRAPTRATRIHSSTRSPSSVAASWWCSAPREPPPRRATTSSCSRRRPPAGRPSSQPSGRTTRRSRSRCSVRT